MQYKSASDLLFLLHSPLGSGTEALPLPPLQNIVFGQRQKPYQAMDALATVATMEADEATTNVAPADQDTATTTGSKSARLAAARRS
jgi:hypothetical protein